jgi:V/A-type H+-transporting ATPase subunit C
MFNEIALAARAKGLATHLLARETLEALADAEDLGALARGLSRLATSIDPVGDPPDAFAIERAAGQTVNRHLRTLYRWQQRTPGVLDVFTAHQDRRSLRALLRGAAQGAPSEARLAGLLPTPSLPRLALIGLARQGSPAEVVGQLALLAHEDAPRLQGLVGKSQVDLLEVDVALLRGFADRATRAAAAADETVRDLVGALIDIGNVQNAMFISSAPRDLNPAEIFVFGGRWFSTRAFVSAASTGSAQHALAMIATELAKSPLASVLPVTAGEVGHLDRAFLGAALDWLTRAARLNPLSAAPLLLVLFLIEAQTRDLRALAWGAALGAPPSLRKQQLVTPR